jgi:ESCRT-I complex subunit TSG101
MTNLIAILADTRSTQMLALSIESAAIDDCIYYLDMALVHKRLTLEMFLREVRRLTKRQSLAKVNIECDIE